jgi:hypothetical protein
MEDSNKNVVVCLHKNFVREHISYIDRTTGEKREFNQARIPHGTFIDGVDYGGWEFTAAVVSPSALRGESWRDISLLADRKLFLRRSVTLLYCVKLEFDFPAERSAVGRTQLLSRGIAASLLRSR